MARTSASRPIILFFFLAFALAVAAGRYFDDRISINCGSASALAALNGREWLGDVYPKFSSSAVVVEGSSTRTTASREQPFVDPVPYKTARISRSQFSYAFQLNPGQKHIRLHFNPTSYKFNFGFKRLEDLFTVEAGSFTLLTNFSASITARALGLNTFTKEFCITILENQPLSFVFYPATATNPWQGFYAFINGIEIISAPSSVPYCHNDDTGVQVVGTKYVVHIDSATALEMVHRSAVKKDSTHSGVGDDFGGMFTRGAALEKNREKIFHDNTWKIPVDVGFRYLVRLHFCEIGMKMAESDRKDFIILIDQVIAVTNADIIQEMEDKGTVWYKNYMVMVNGNRRERKRDISISLHLKDEFLYGYGPLEGFEIFKLSNHDNNLASPNPLPPTQDSSSQTTRKLLAVLGSQNTVSTLVVAVICLVNIIVYKLRQTWKANFAEEENMPSTKVKTLCRHFSLTEIRLATDNFNDAFAIGKGGFGKVYKGRIDNGQQTVAIKRLKSNSKQGKREFQTEIEMLSELRHVNLVSLVGYCCEHREMILVYEYMPRGSLADHLYKLARKDNTSSSLSWKQRLKICIGAGQGLDYLHTGRMIIHRDVKASNILLDENFVAKVSDFGLAKGQSGQSQASTNFKGTFGYFDPDYFRTRRLTMKSDTYSFGVVLLEVLCGRPAVEPWVEEDKRSLTLWACNKISKGEDEQIVDPNLREEISPASLKAFVKVAEKCLHDEPKKRPAIRHVIINLEFALEQQEDVNSLDPKKITTLADVLPFNGTTQLKNANSLVPNETAHVAVSTHQLKDKSSLQKDITYAAEAVPYTDKILQGKEKSLLPTETTLAADALFPSNGITIHPGDTRRLTMTSNVKNVTSPFKEKFYSKKISVGIKDRVKASMRNLSRLWPWWNSTKPSKKKDSVISISAPVACGNMKSRGSTLSEDEKGGNNKLLISPNLKIFSLAELAAVTRNFHDDNVLGEGGFGRVYKGWLNENGTEYAVAIKRQDSESMQGLKEWMCEVNFLGRLSHPNMIKLLGYCLEHNEQLLVYELMQKGNLEYQLFQRDIEPLSWDIRVKILTGAARGLAFLHALDRNIIYRDFKSSNILLDRSYHAKLSDFGLALWGPVAEHSHVSTGIIGTCGYAAPEYIATGHLYVKSDVYGFGVVLLEMLTGLRALDKNRPTGQQSLVHWIKPLLSNRRKLDNLIDPRLEGRYPVKCAFQIAQLAQNCLENEPKKRPSSQQIVEILEKNQS